MLYHQLIIAILTTAYVLLYFVCVFVFFLLVFVA